MNKLYLAFICSLFVNLAIGQAPNKISYQSVLRYANNSLVISKTVGMRVSILKGNPNGTSVFIETQNPTTNNNGLISIEIGGGSLVSGDFSAIDWGGDTYFVKTEIDPNGGTNYAITGVSQFLSVPYALNAKSASSLSNPAQLSIKGDSIFISNGNYIVIPGLSYSKRLIPIQQRLDNGETPIQIYNSDKDLLESIYGKMYQGGLIFYLDVVTGKGLVGAPTDQSQSIIWNLGNSQLVGTSEAIGSGKSNTQDIVAAQGAGNYAAYLCDTLTFNGYNDWFLPSANELKAMSEKLHLRNIGGFDLDYWSSSEGTFFPSTNAIFYDFNSNSSSNVTKNVSLKVRAIRSF